MKLIKFKLNVVALLATLISVLMTGCSDQYEVAKKQGVVFSQDGTVLIKCNDTTISECVIPDGVIQIERGAFRDCKYLKNVKIPSSVTTIGHGAFNGCDNLKEVRVPKNCEIGVLVFPDSCKVIEY